MIAALQIEPQTTQDLLMLSKLGQAVRIPVAQVRLTGRNCQGVIVMRMTKPEDEIANVSLVDELSEEDSAANAAKVASDENAADLAAAFDAKRAAEQAELDAKVEEQQRLAQEAAENAEDPQ